MTRNKFGATCDGCGLQVAPGSGVVSGPAGARMVTHVECRPPTARLLPLAGRSPAWPVSPPSAGRGSRRALSVFAVTAMLAVGALIVLGPGTDRQADGASRPADAPAGSSGIAVPSSSASPSTTPTPPAVGALVAQAVVEPSLDAVPIAAEASVQTLPPRPPSTAARRVPPAIEAATALDPAVTTSTVTTSTIVPPTTSATPTASSPSTTRPTAVAVTTTRAPKPPKKGKGSDD